MVVKAGESTVRSAGSRDALARSDGLAILWVWPYAAIRRDPLASPHMVVGRGEDCQIRLDHVSVSRTHAEIYRQGPIFAVRDLGSTNGIYVNGKRIQHAPLALGHVLRVGHYVGVVTNGPACTQSNEFSKLAEGFWGGAELCRQLEPARRAATTALPIVLVGETGTGKERLARAIHEWSGREGPFHAVNCAALPVSLAEAELFGYRKGAFTGAAQASLGHLRAADRGTLLLDEAADLPLEVQSKLLRALEERTICSLGATKQVPVDVRILVATQRPLADLVAQGSFRADLQARVSGLTVVVAPLRDRKEDVPPLLQHFLGVHSGGRPPDVDPKLVECLCLQSWPQNVRELELLVRQLLALHGGEPVLRRSFLPPAYRVTSTEYPSAAEPVVGENRRQHDLRRLVGALRQTHGNLKAAAAAVGFSRQRAYRLLDGRRPAALMAEYERGDLGECGDEPD